MVTCGVRGGGGKNCQIFADAICYPLSFYFPDMQCFLKDLMFNGQILISQFLYDCYFLISPYCPFILTAEDWHMHIESYRHFVFVLIKCYIITHCYIRK